MLILLGVISYHFTSKEVEVLTIGSELLRASWLVGGGAYTYRQGELEKGIGESARNFMVSV